MRELLREHHHTDPAGSAAERVHSPVDIKCARKFGRIIENKFFDEALGLPERELILMALFHGMADKGDITSDISDQLLEALRMILPSENGRFSNSKNGRTAPSG